MATTVLLWAALAAAGAMTLAWWIVRVSGSGGWTDVAWTFATGLIGAGAALAPAPGGILHRQWLVAALVSAWAVRLGGYVAARTWKADEVDPRYEKLKREWGGWGFKAWVFLMLQAATVMVLVVAVRAAAIRPDAPLGWREIVAVAILAVAVLGEGLADRQMGAFRRAKGNKGKVINTGLWAWSRHPNYFFEWFGWLAYPVIALTLSSHPVGWLSLLAPLQMWWLLNHVSGVPMLEEQMLKTRPAAYRAYQQRVSRFLPLPPKNPA